MEDQNGEVMESRGEGGGGSEWRGDGEVMESRGGGSEWGGDGE